jgi:hypothetical protein
MLCDGAGATFPGEFEERLRGVLSELTAAGSKAVLFIDDIHGITGPNAQQGGGVMDASVLLKPLLARWVLQSLRCHATCSNPLHSEGWQGRVAVLKASSNHASGAALLLWFPAKSIVPRTVHH